MDLSPTVVVEAQVASLVKTILQSITQLPHNDTLCFISILLSHTTHGAPTTSVFLDLALYNIDYVHTRWQGCKPPTYDACGECLCHKARSNNNISNTNIQCIYKQKGSTTTTTTIYYYCYYYHTCHGSRENGRYRLDFVGRI